MKLLFDILLLAEAVGCEKLAVKNVYATWWQTFVTSSASIFLSQNHVSLYKVLLNLLTMKCKLQTCQSFSVILVLMFYFFGKISQ